MRIKFKLKKIQELPQKGTQDAFVKLFEEMKALKKDEKVHIVSGFRNWKKLWNSLYFRRKEHGCKVYQRKNEFYAVKG